MAGYSLDGLGRRQAPRIRPELDILGNPALAGKQAAIDAVSGGGSAGEPTLGGDVGDEAGYGPGPVVDPNQGPMFRGPDGTMVAGRAGAPVSGAVPRSGMLGAGGYGIGGSRFLSTLANNETDTMGRYGGSQLFSGLMEQQAPMGGFDPAEGLLDELRAKRQGRVGPYRRQAIDSLLGRA